MAFLRNSFVIKTLISAKSQPQAVEFDSLLFKFLSIFLTPFFFFCCLQLSSSARLGSSFGGFGARAINAVVSLTTVVTVEADVSLETVVLTESVLLLDPFSCCFDPG